MRETDRGVLVAKCTCGATLIYMENELLGRQWCHWHPTQEQEDWEDDHLLLPPEVMIPDYLFDSWRSQTEDPTEIKKLINYVIYMETWLKKKKE